MATQTLTYAATLDIVTCWCGIKHAIPSDLHRQARSDPKFSVHCPLGHEWVHRKSDATKEREKREQVERQLANERDTARRWRENAEAEKRQKAAYKGHLTRMRKRIGNGVCPVPGCKRSGFDRVLSHIASQHPDWLHDHPELTENT